MRTLPPHNPHHHQRQGPPTPQQRRNTTTTTPMVNTTCNCAHLGALGRITADATPRVTGFKDNVIPTETHHVLPQCTPLGNFVTAATAPPGIANPMPAARGSTWAAMDPMGATADRMVMEADPLGRTSRTRWWRVPWLGRTLGRVGEGGDWRRRTPELQAQEAGTGVVLQRRSYRPRRRAWQYW